MGCGRERRGRLVSERGFCEAAVCEAEGGRWWRPASPSLRDRPNPSNLPIMVPLMPSRTSSTKGSQCWKMSSWVASGPEFGLGFFGDFLGFWARGDERRSAPGTQTHTKHKNPQPPASCRSNPILPHHHHLLPCTWSKRNVRVLVEEAAALVAPPVPTPPAKTTAAAPPLSPPPSSVDRHAGPSCGPRGRMRATTDTLMGTALGAGAASAIWGLGFWGRWWWVGGSGAASTARQLFFLWMGRWFGVSIVRR